MSKEVRDNALSHLLVFVMASRPSRASNPPGRLTNAEGSQSGRRVGAKNMSPTEVDKLLSLVEEYLPLSRSEWIRDIIPRFNQNVPLSLHRNYHTLFGKFSKLVREKPPTGTTTSTHIITSTNVEIYVVNF